MLTPEEEQRRTELIRAGLKPKQIADMLGRSLDAIRKWAKKRGYQTRTKKDGFHKGNRSEQERQAAQLLQERLARAENMRRLNQDAMAANNAKLSYGKWRAQQVLMAEKTAESAQKYVEKRA